MDARALGGAGERRRLVLSPADTDRIASAVVDGDSDLSTEVATGTLGEDERWRFGPLLVTKPTGTGTLAAHPTDVDSVPLAQICDILPGRNRVGRTADVSRDVRVIRAADVGTNLTLWADLPWSNAEKGSSVRVLPGDIIGSVSPPHGRWAIVPEHYGQALASDHTVVLRRRADVSMWYVLGYLRSERGRRWIATRTFQGIIPRIKPDLLAQLPVPVCPLGASQVDRLLQSYDAELARLSSEVGQLHGRLSGIYDGESRVEVAANLDALQGITASVRSVTNLNSALRIAKSSFPYPISRTLRAIDRTVSARERYHEVVHEGLGTIATVLAALCAGVARTRLISGRAIKNWADAAARSGATIGTQRAMVLEVARAVLEGGDRSTDIGGLGQALGDSGSPAVMLTGTLLAERNRLHGDYPRSDYQFRQRLDECALVMDQLLDALSSLARWELRYAEAVEPVEADAGGPAYSGTFRVLQGDNPDWDVAMRVSDSPLYRGRVYALVDGDVLLDLHPFLLVLDCPQCGAREVYYPDTYGESETSLKSIDRGHSQVSSDARLLRDIRAAYTALAV